MVAKPTFASIDDYIAAQPAESRRALQRLRGAIRKAVPNGEETISYKIPTVTLHGRTVLHFAGWKGYYSIYPANSSLLAAFKNEIHPYLASKSTLRFSLAQPIPSRLIERIARFRAQEITASRDTRPERSPKPRRRR